MKYDLKKRIFLVQKYYKLKSITLIQRSFSSNFKNEKAPTHKIISNIISCFEKTGSVMKIPHIKKEPTQKRQEVKNQLETMVTEFPKLTIRKAASAIGVSPTHIFNILHDDLHLKPYKLHNWNKLECHDYERRVKFANWFLGLPKDHKYFFICSDEAYFYLTLPLNRQNNRIWSDSIPFDAIEVPLHDEKVLVWCAFSAEVIYGPYFFESTVKAGNYLEMLKSFFWRRHCQAPNASKYYFQQDGATAHTANTVQKWLKGQFGKFFLDKTKWPPRSPDLNPCDFYLWGYLKSVVYNPLPKTLDELKSNIEREIKKISPEILKSVFLNFEKRCELIITAEGGHIEDK
jgi:hypothetical protein